MRVARKLAAASVLLAAVYLVPFTRGLATSGTFGAAPLAGVTGEVIDRLGHPVPGATVEAQRIGGPGMGEIVPWALTDGHGQFRLQLRYGRFWLGAGKPAAGYPDALLSQLYGTAIPATVSLSASHPSAKAVIRLGPRAALLLPTVIDASTGEALPRVGPQAPSIRWDITVPSRRGMDSWLFRMDRPGHFIPSARDVRVTITARGYGAWRGTFHLPPGAQKALTVRLEPVGPAAAAARAPAGVTLQISLNHDRVSPGGNVNLDVVLTNGSNRSIRLWAPPPPAARNNMGVFDISIIGPGGRPASAKGSAPLAGVGLGVPFELAPGQAIHSTVVLTERYDLTAPGRYSIRVAPRVFEWELASNTIYLTVVRH